MNLNKQQSGAAGLFLIGLGLVWWLLSLFLGPLATLILVILPKVRAKMF